MTERNKNLFYYILFCLLVGGFVTYHLKLVLNQEENKTLERVTNTSFLIGEWIKGAFVASDYILRDMVYSVPVSALQFPAQDADEHSRISKYIVDKQKTVPFSNGVGLNDKNCIVTHTPSIVGFDASSREWCKFLMNNPERETHVSNMFLSNTGDMMVLQSRVFPGEGHPGQAGVGVNLEFFSNLLENLTLSLHGVVAISDQNINLLARKPALPELLGKKVNDPFFEAFIATDETFITFRGVSPVDGEPRLYAFRKVSGLPFVIVVGEADKDWQAGWMYNLWMTVAGVAALWGLAALVLHSYWCRLDNLAELQEAKDSLEQLSITDELTGLANRRRFDEVLHAEYHRIRRNQAPLSLVMIDIDYFKAFNDTYGHQEGDNCLRLVAEAIKNTVRRSQDLACRYGGEEFCCILPETDQQAAIFIATNIRKSIAAINIRHEGSKIANHVTASLGVASISYDKHTPPDQIVKAADAHLYWAKKNGRNCVGYDGAKAQNLV